MTLRLLPTPLRRTASLAVGTLLEAWRYAARTVPIYRTEVAVPPTPDVLEHTPLDRELADNVQRASRGVGPRFHRTYAARIAGSGRDAREVATLLATDFAAMTPDGITDVEQPDGDHRIEVGDDVRIHLSGPWNAPVRTIETTPTSFRFATLEGHMEAGEIEFRVEPAGDGDLEFTIESWARSATVPFAAVYHPLGVGKEVQLHMWVTVIERLATRAGGHMPDGVRVITRRQAATSDD